MNLVYLNYKEPLRAVVDGFGYQGTLAQTEDGEFVQCHICGKLAANLGSHVYNAHRMMADEYKQKFQLAKMTPLCSDTFSRKAKERTLEWMKTKTSEELERVNVAKNGAHHNRKFEPRSLTLEEMNRKGICPDQLLDRIRQAADALGKTPTVVELNSYHQTQRYQVPIIRTFGSYKKACELAGLVPNKPGGGGGAKVAHTREGLLQMLKDYYTRWGIVPTANDCARGFLPPIAVYVKHFGSIKKARKEAGLQEYVSTKHGLTSWQSTGAM